MCQHVCDVTLVSLAVPVRVVTKRFLDDLSDELVNGGRVYFQSDVEEVYLAATETFGQCPRFVRLATPTTPPFAIQTDRERHVLSTGGVVYRCDYQLDKSRPVLPDPPEDDSYDNHDEEEDDEYDDDDGDADLTGAPRAGP